MGWAEVVIVAVAVLVFGVAFFWPDGRRRTSQAANATLENLETQIGESRSWR